MKYLKLFDEHSGYGSFVSGNTFDRPNVSHCILENEIHYNPSGWKYEYLTIEMLEDGFISYDYTRDFYMLPKLDTYDLDAWFENETVETIIGYIVDDGYCTMDEVSNITTKEELRTFIDEINDVRYGHVSYSVDNGQTWVDFVENETQENIIPSGTKVLIKGNLNDYLVHSDHGYGNYGTTFRVFNESGNNVQFNVMGNILSLSYGDDFVDKTNGVTNNEVSYIELFTQQSVVDASNLVIEHANVTCRSMFSGCHELISPPKLPAMELVDIELGGDTEGCYQSMFRDCTSLTTAPELPATTLASDCYYYMFNGCASLTIAPELPATTLASGCYAAMFRGCTSLTVAPELPATSLTSHCYDSMFEGCTSLTTAPELPATTLASYCYQSMFNGCTSLVIAPELPATTLTSSCYYTMFSNCTSLTTAPELPAITLASYCYERMFYGCTSLINAPELPATTLATSCYNNMFSECTSLTSAPELPATTLVSSCYPAMFRGCTSLNYIKCLATDISPTNCTTNWVSGVAASGTFIKVASMTSWQTGVNGIPTGWTVQDATV